MYNVLRTLKISHATTVVLFVAVASLILGVVYAPVSRAADINGFNPGNIMSDGVMSNKESMNIGQIQAFLDSKNTCNNTNVYMAAWYPHLQYNIRDGRFLCMAKDSFNGKSAAQIIWQVGQDYNINPQMLIVLLEKEQGLITDTWPNHVQYRSATGYGCPDTAPCDAQYYGLENQLRQAANLFRNVLNGGWSNYPVGSTYVRYNPTVSCGGSVVNIQNRATSALYRYTPYQPNQSALNAGYGRGDDCGAYGNRNFWLLFTDWFGSTSASRWTTLLDPRVLVTLKDTYKINPDSGEKTQLVSAGSQIAFPTKTTLANGNGCLRTRLDSINNSNQCIKYEDLGEFSPKTTDIKIDSSIAIKEANRWTCKVNYRTLEITNQCFDIYTQINFLKKTTVAGVNYLITKNDINNGNPTAFLASRFTDVTDVALSAADKQQKNLTWTCKVDLSTRAVIPSQCYDKDTIVSFSKLRTIDNTQYLITDHDDLHAINSAFIAKRFVAVE